MHSLDTPSPLVLLIGLVVFLTLVGCDDGSPTTGTPHSLQVQVDPAMEPRVGALIPSPIIIRVVDEAGAGVVGELVSFTIEAGGGSLAEAVLSTSDGGEARLEGWRMGETPGTNQLRIAVVGLEPATVTVEAGPGAPATARFQAELPPESPVAVVLADLPDFEIFDAFGNPVSGEMVTFVPSEGGSVSSATVATGADGVAESPAWTLGPGAGLQTLEARVTGLPATVLGIETLAGPPELVFFDTPQDQHVEVGLFVPHPPVLAVTDAHGNGIPDIDVQISLEVGGGSIDVTDDRTDASGRARVERWTMGSEPGENRVRGEALGIGTAELVAHAVGEDADPMGRYFRVGAIHVNQGNQTLDGEIPLVEGRAGLLRVWITSSTAEAPAPPARIRIYRDDELLEETMVSSGVEEAPVVISSDATTPSWNHPLPGEWIDDRLRVEVDVDPDHQVGVVTRRFSHFPHADTETGWYSVVNPDPLRVRMIPIEDESSGVRGQVDAANIDDYMSMARAALPIANDEVSLGDPLVVTLLDGNGALRIVLPEILAAWTASEYRDHYFQGIFPHQGSGGFAMRAYFTEDPAHPAPVAMTYDLTGARQNSLAQSLMHNMGRWHAPCGVRFGPEDPEYPHELGSIGTMGYHPVQDRLQDPRDLYRDLSAGCAPIWISDYSFGGVLDWRLAEVWDGGEAGAITRESGLLVWGSVEDGAVTLEPAVPVVAMPRMPDREGPYRVRATDEDGAEIFSFGFAPEAIGGPDASDGEAFAWMVPVSSADQERIRTIEVEAPGSLAVQSARTSPQGAPVANALDTNGIAEAAFTVHEAASGVTTRVEWDPGVFPTAWILDEDSGAVRGILRSGTVDLTRFEGRVEVVLSDGVRGWLPTPEGLEPIRK